MQMARVLIKAGRLEHARAFLEQARPSGEEERIERLFLLGRIEMRLGLPRRAVERFEAILVLRPSLTRVRLELARAYYLSGRDNQAGRQFSLSLADDLPPSAEAAVEDFLQRIDARKRWSASLSASILPETRRTDRETILIGGVPFRLNEDARSSSGTGGLVAAGISFSPTVAEDIRGVLAASAAAKVYERSEWNDATVSGDAGLARLFDRGSVSGGLRLGRRWIGGDGYHRNLGTWTQFRLRLSNVAHLDLAVSAGYRKHDTLPGRDGWRVAVNPRLLYVLDGRTTIEVAPAFETVEAKTEHHGNRLGGSGGDGFAGVRGRPCPVARACRPRPAACRKGSSFRKDAGRQELQRLGQATAPVATVRRIRTLRRLLIRTHSIQYSDTRLPEPRRDRRRLTRVLTDGALPGGLGA